MMEAAVTKGADMERVMFGNRRDDNDDDDSDGVHDYDGDEEEDDEDDDDNDDDDDDCHGVDDEDGDYGDDCDGVVVTPSPRSEHGQADRRDGKPGGKGAGPGGNASLLLGQRHRDGHHPLLGLMRLPRSSRPSRAQRRDNGSKKPPRDNGTPHSGQQGACPRPRPRRDSELAHQYQIVEFCQARESIGGGTAQVPPSSIDAQDL